MKLTILIDEKSEWSPESYKQACGRIKRPDTPEIVMTAFDWLWELNLVCCGFFSTERPKQKASNSELRRWFDKGSVIINGVCPKATDPIIKVNTLVLFPKSNKMRRTYKF